MYSDAVPRLAHGRAVWCFEVTPTIVAIAAYLQYALQRTVRLSRWACWPWKHNANIDDKAANPIQHKLRLVHRHLHSRCKKPPTSCGAPCKDTRDALQRHFGSSVRFRRHGIPCSDCPVCARYRWKCCDVACENSHGFWTWSALFIYWQSSDGSTSTILWKELGSSRICGKLVLNALKDGTTRTFSPARPVCNSHQQERVCNQSLCTVQ